MTTEHKPGDFLNQILHEIKTQPLPSPHIRPLPFSKKGERTDHSPLQDIFKNEPSSLPSTEQVIDGNPFPLPETEWIKNTSKAKKTLANLNQSALGIAISYESEVDPFSSPLLTLQISTDEAHTLIFDIMALGGLELFEPLLISHKICKVMYDAKPILRYFYAQGIRFDIQNIMDIMLVDQLLHAGESDIKYTLDDLVLRELDLHLPPISMTSARLSSASAILHLLASKLWPRIKTEQLLKIAKLENEVVKALALMENNGVFFNAVDLAKTQQDRQLKKDEIARELIPLLSEERESILGMIPRKINLDSRVQVKKALNKRGIPVISTDEETLLPLAQDYPVVAKLIEYNKLKYEVSNFSGSILKHIHSITGRVHSHFGQLQTSTGRLNSFDPSLQNIKRGEHRSFLQASPGNLLIIADYKQIDIFVAAAMSQEENMLKILRSGGDIHVKTAMDITGKTNPEEVTSEERRKAKAVNFGLLYKMTAFGLVQYAKYNYGIDMSVDEAQRIIDLYHKEYPNLTQWQDRLIEASNLSFETRTLWNRRRLFITNEFCVTDTSDDLQKTILGLGFSPELNKGKLYFSVSKQRTPEVVSVLGNLNVEYSYSPQTPKPTEIANSPVQGTSADILKLALVYTTQTLNVIGAAKLILNVHDEILVESPIERVDEVGLAIQQCMEDAGEKILKIIRPGVSVSIGPTWASKV